MKLTFWQEPGCRQSQGAHHRGFGWVGCRPSTKRNKHPKGVIEKRDRWGSATVAQPCEYPNTITSSFEMEEPRTQSTLYDLERDLATQCNFLGSLNLAF